MSAPRRTLLLWLPAALLLACAEPEPAEPPPASADRMCEPGEPWCPCDDAGGCISGHECGPTSTGLDACIPCPPGSEGCPCQEPAGWCEAGLACEYMTCWPG